MTEMYLKIHSDHLLHRIILNLFNSIYKYGQYKRKKKYPK